MAKIEIEDIRNIIINNHRMTAAILNDEITCTLEIKETPINKYPIKKYWDIYTPINGRFELLDLRKD